MAGKRDDRLLRGDGDWGPPSQFPIRGNGDDRPEVDQHLGSVPFVTTRDCMHVTWCASYPFPPPGYRPDSWQTPRAVNPQACTPTRFYRPHWLPCYPTCSSPITSRYPSAGITVPGRASRSPMPAAVLERLGHLPDLPHLPLQQPPVPGLPGPVPASYRRLSGQRGRNLSQPAHTQGKTCPVAADWSGNRRRSSSVDPPSLLPSQDRSNAGGLPLLRPSLK